MRASLFLFLLCFSVDIFGQSTNTNQPISQPDKSQGGVTLPDGTFIPNSPKKPSDSNNQTQASGDLKPASELQDGASKDAYNSLKQLYEKQKVTIQYIPKDDGGFYNDSIILLDNYFKAYEEGNMDLARSLFVRFNEKLKDTLNNKPIIAYKYNELIKKYLETDVSFGIYKNSDDFYLAVGEGSFKTVATLSVDNIMGIIQAYDKAAKWAVQCLEEKMEVNKPMGTFGGVTLEFESKAEGKFTRFILEIKGQMDSDRLLSDQTVWMTGLNFSCLINKMRNAPEMYQKHKKSQENANKLK